MRLFLRRPFFAADGQGGGSAEGSGEGSAGSSADITHDEPGYSDGLVGVDDILTPDKFSKGAEVTSDDIAALSGVPGAPAEAGVPGEPAQPEVDPIDSLFAPYEEGIEKPSEPELPDGVDPKSATAQIYRQQSEQLKQLQAQNSDMSGKFQQMYHAYDHTVGQQQQQIALLQQQLQQLQGGGQQQPPPPPPVGASYEGQSAYQQLLARFRSEVGQTYDPRIEQLEEQVKQTNQMLAMQREKQQRAAQQRKYIADARRDLHMAVFKSRDIPPDSPLFDQMLDFTYAIAAKTGQPVAVCAREAEKRVMALAKAFLQSSAKRSSKTHQQMKSEPRTQPSGGLPLKGTGAPSAELLRANGFDSEYDWDLQGRPLLTRKPVEIPELVPGDV